jgi:nicotine oxidoreductase
MTKSNLFKACVICGSLINIEMHHVRSIKILRSGKTNKDFFTRQMAAINRKQLPLCSDHHIQLHNNTMSEEDLNKFKKNTARKKKKNNNK